MIKQTTVAEIRLRSGVSNGALFHHFPSKEAIADALYVDSISSFQVGLWRLLQRRPRPVRSAVRGVITHQIEWIIENIEQAKFVYARGTLEWDSPVGPELAEMNQRIGDAYRAWLGPFIERGEIREMRMLVLNAIVTGPTHAIARRWVAGQLSAPLEDYRDDLVDAACAALTGSPASARRSSRPSVSSGRVRLELVAEDGSIVGRGEANAEIVLPVRPGWRGRR